MNYNIIPKPEACSTLYTNYNIRTSGIVMGANLETAVYKVNTLGSEVGVIENDITDLKQAVQSLYNICAQLEAEINSVESDLDWMTITDAVFGFVGAAASGVKTFITKSANVFKAGERDVIRAAENQVHLSADSVRVGQRTIAREEEGAVHLRADEAHFESCGIANEEHNVLFNPDEITMRDIAGNETALTNEGLRIANGGNVARLTPQTLDIGAFNASILNEADDLLGRLNINGRPFARLVYNLKDLGMKLYHDMAFQKLLSGVLTISWIGSTVVDIVKFGMNQTKEKTYIDVSADLLILQQLIDKWASFNDFEQGNNLDTSLATAETINRVINERAHPVNSVFMTTETIDVSNYLGFSWVLLKSDDGINFYKRTA